MITPSSFVLPIPCAARANGLFQPVLPAAIEQDILIALHPTSRPRVRLSNVLPSFESTEFDLTPPSEENREWHVDFISPVKGGGWDNYVKVALAEGLSEFFEDGKGRSVKAPRGMDLVVSGTVPPGSGLSVSQGYWRSCQHELMRGRARRRLS